MGTPLRRIGGAASRVALAMRGGGGVTAGAGGGATVALLSCTTICGVIAVSTEADVAGAGAAVGAAAGGEAGGGLLGVADGAGGGRSLLLTGAAVVRAAY